MNGRLPASAAPAAAPAATQASQTPMSDACLLQAFPRAWEHPGSWPRPRCQQPRAPAQQPPPQAASACLLPPQSPVFRVFQRSARRCCTPAPAPRAALEGQAAGGGGATGARRRAAGEGGSWPPPRRGRRAPIPAVVELLQLHAPGLLCGSCAGFWALVRGAALPRCALKPGPPHSAAPCAGAVRPAPPGSRRERRPLPAPSRQASCSLGCLRPWAACSSELPPARSVLPALGGA